MSSRRKAEIAHGENERFSKEIRNVSVLQNAPLAPKMTTKLPPDKRERGTTLLVWLGNQRLGDSLSSPIRNASDFQNYEL
jgi:hypothetical protein